MRRHIGFNRDNDSHNARSSRESIVWLLGAVVQKVYWTRSEMEPVWFRESRLGTRDGAYGNRFISWKLDLCLTKWPRWLTPFGDVEQAWKPPSYNQFTDGFNFSIQFFNFLTKVHATIRVAKPSKCFLNTDTWCWSLLTAFQSFYIPNSISRTPLFNRRTAL